MEEAENLSWAKGCQGEAILSEVDHGWKSIESN